MTGNMDGGEATGDRQLLSISHEMFNRGSVNRRHGPHEQPEHDAGQQTWRRLHGTKSSAGLGNGSVNRMHIGVSRSGHLEHREAADVVGVRVCQYDMANVLRLL